MEDATKEESEGEVIWSEKEKKKGRRRQWGGKGQRHKKEKYEIDTGLMIRIKIEEIERWKKGNIECS